MAQRMRASMTAPERFLWEALRKRQVDGLRFRSQHPLGRFILDFCCPSIRLAIEVDGPDHRPDTDEARDEHLFAYGYTVLRFSNEEVLTDLGSVLARIRAVALRRPARSDRIVAPRIGGQGAMQIPPRIGGQGAMQSPPRIGGQGGEHNDHASPSTRGQR